MKNNKYFKIIINCLGFMMLITIFNNICNLYNMSSLHRVICIFAISFSHIFTTRLCLIYENSKLNKYKEDDII